MGLLSFLKRRSRDAAPAPSAPASDAVDSVQQARTRARQRLIGAVVLVTAGVIGFPMLFETQPRPLSVNTPIEIARRDVDATTSRAAVTPSPGTAPRPGGHAPAPAATVAATPDIITESEADSGRELPPLTPPASSGASNEAPAPSAKPAASKPAAAEKKPDAAKPTASSSDRQRAESLLSGHDTPSAKKPSTPGADGARFIVQVGAFGDTAAAREARQKVEKLGLKTFTQVVETSSGKRIRVRVGPFSSRAEADKAAGKLKSSGLASAVYTL